MKIFSFIGSTLLMLQAVDAYHPLSEERHRHDNVAGAHEVVRVNKKGAKNYTGREKMLRKRAKPYRQRINNRNIRMHKV